MDSNFTLSGNQVQKEKSESNLISTGELVIYQLWLLLIVLFCSIQLIRLKIYFAEGSNDTSDGTYTTLGEVQSNPQMSMKKEYQRKIIVYLGSRKSIASYYFSKSFISVATFSKEKKSFVESLLYLCKNCVVCVYKCCIV